MTKKQQIFADEYLKDCNATRAYKAAYPNSKKDNVAAAAGARLLRNVNVISYIEQRQEEIASERIADVKEIMEFYTSVLRGEVQDSFGLDASLSDRLAAGRELLKRYERTEGDRKEKYEDNGLVNAIKAAASAREAKT